MCFSHATAQKRELANNMRIKCFKETAFAAEFQILWNRHTYLRQAASPTMPALVTKTNSKCWRLDRRNSNKHQTPQHRKCLFFGQSCLGKNTALTLHRIWSSHLWEAALPGPRPWPLLLCPQSRSVRRHSPWDHLPGRLQCSTGCLPWQNSLKKQYFHRSSFRTCLTEDNAE